MKSGISRMISFKSIPVVFLYFIVLFLSFYIVDVKSIQHKAGIISLNRLRPASFQYLIDYSEGKKEFNRRDLEAFRHYYHYVTRYVTNRPDAYGLLGYTSFKLGKIQKAAKAYSAAIKMNQAFFWFHYNLGVIQYKEGNYQKSLEHFQEAVSKDPVTTLLFISKSDKLYIPLYRDKIKENEKFFKQQLKTGFLESYEMILLCYEQLGQIELMFNAAKEIIENTNMNSDVFYYYAGIAALKLKAADKSVYYLQKYIRNNKNDAKAFEHLGVSLKILGEEEKAVLAIRNSVILRNTVGDRPSLGETIDLRLF